MQDQQSTASAVIGKICRQAKNCSYALAQLSSAQKNQALLAMAAQLTNSKQAILAANEQDLTQARQQQLSAALLDRLTLTASRIDAMITGLQAISELPDPVGATLANWTVPSGLQITRVAIPLGVIGVIYESRPNVTVDAAALCLKSGNCVILRGGSESMHSNHAIAACLQRGLIAVDLPAEMIQLVPSQDRSFVNELLSMDDYIDVIIPRGGESLIKHIRKHSSIPTFSHLAGLCHTYIHQQADLRMAQAIICNAKLRRTGICGATETLLIDEAIAEQFLPPILQALIAQGCEIRGDQFTQSLHDGVIAATDLDWSAEYLDAILSVKVVPDLQAAVDHIQQYGSNHTEAIITDDVGAAQQFQHSVNSAIVMHNCSTQFADGGEFGMGAEIGIATGKLHARGPVGLAQLTTFKYVVAGTGQIRQP